MNITSYIPLTRAQERTLHAFEGVEANVEVKTSLIAPAVVATFNTFQGQYVKVTMDENGVIIHTEFGYAQ